MDIGSKIVFAVIFIGVVTFLLSAIGVKIGNLFGMKFKSKAELFGGVVLVLMGLKIFLEDLGYLDLPF
jgi:putative Mn2+ efflux pump MntP